jgi:NAD(P)-dependent dehydrogenase (short-subunit alcohol dehydrogenase family)
MRKTKVEKVFDKYAKGYSSGALAPSRYDTARSASSFANDITWHFLTKYLPKCKSIKILDAGGGLSYMLTKSAGIPLTRGLARALIPYIRVNAIQLRFIETGWILALPDEVKEKMKKALLSKDGGNQKT